MGNECMEIIRDGLRAFDRTRHHPLFRLTALFDDAQEHDCEWQAACAIRDRLDAVRTVHAQRQLTLAAYCAAERRLARLLDAPRAETGEADGYALPSQETEGEAGWQKRADEEAHRICSGFSADRGWDREYHRYALSKYRGLLENLEALRALYAPELCEQITQAVFDRLVLQRRF